MKLWAGRFQKETDSAVNDFNSSIAFDARMYRQDIAGSIAHATMLGEQGIIEAHEAEKIIEGLTAILADIEEGNVEFTVDMEDIHMNIESLLTGRIGQTGKRLHTVTSVTGAPQGQTGLGVFRCTCCREKRWNLFSPAAKEATFDLKRKNTQARDGEHLRPASAIEWACGHRPVCREISLCAP